MPTKGAVSGRLFDPSRAGGKILKLSYLKVTITSRGVDLVESHVRRFNPVGQAEIRMVDRLRNIAQGRLKPEPVDLRFYTHELREYIRYKKLGYSTGQPPDPDLAYELWNNAHTATLEDYSLKEGFGVLFHPSVED
ncbi:hypothetical protein V0288_05495 [Pannus brasiliensis CCIBt3594]|uniref:Uncharacterized protein n=1 Tax=Pannus brasiliensis CCIBt3594 TaxID=1427578 RepID=A0AAW9QRJ5_9CHRO